MVGGNSSPEIQRSPLLPLPAPRPYPCPIPTPRPRYRPGLPYLLLMPTLTYPSHPGLSWPSRPLGCSLSHVSTLLQPHGLGPTQAHAHIPLDPRFVLVLPFGHAHTLPQKHVPTYLCICLTQSSRRSEPREAQQSSTPLTQSRHLVVQMGKQRSRGVEWKQTSWVGGGVAKSQGGVRGPVGFP